MVIPIQFPKARLLMMDTDSFIFKVGLTKQQEEIVKKGKPLDIFKDTEEVRFGGNGLGNLKDETAIKVSYKGKKIPVQCFIQEFAGVAAKVHALLIRSLKHI